MDNGLLTQTQKTFMNKQNKKNCYSSNELDAIHIYMRFIFFRIVTR